MIKTILAIILFVLGLYFIYTNYKHECLEAMTNKNDHNCPNMLVQKDNNYFLYNSKLAIVPGVNPIQFSNLDEYVEFLEWQRGQGINCPVLELQYSTDPQSNDVYKIKPSIFNNQGGLPSSKGLLENDTTGILDANMDNEKYNQGTYGFDPENQYIGLDTPIDQIRTNMDPSPNAMDTNWGGSQYTQKLFKEGKLSK